MCMYCDENKLVVNPAKTKIVVFSRGKIRNKPKTPYGNDNIEVVDDYTYLGIVFNYNGRFVKAQKRLCNLANNAMFTILKRARKLHLDVDTQLHLFNSIVAPILLYGSEYGAMMN